MAPLGHCYAIPCRAMDSPILPELLGQIPEDEQIGTVTADGANDTRRCHAAITERQAIPIIPIRKNGKRRLSPTFRLA